MLPAIAKVPFLLCAIPATWVTFTQPKAPAPTAGERMKPKSIPELLFAAVFQYLFPLLRLSVTLLAMAEALTVIATNFSSDTPFALGTVLSRFHHQHHAFQAPSIRFTSSFLAAFVIYSIGGYLRWASYRALGRLFTFELTVRKEHMLVTWGPYAYVRHPSYIGGLLVQAGVVHALFGAGSWLRECIGLTWRAEAAVMVIVLSFFGSVAIDRALIEDGMMKSEFGAVWDEWAGNVRSRLIPGVW